MTIPVSVVIPAYGRASTLPRAVDSVRSQPRIDAEIIVVDDGSPDPVGAGFSDPAVRVVRADQNRGAGPARNLGVSHASHETLAFLDVDDEWFPGSAQARLALLKRGSVIGGAQLVMNDLTGSARLLKPPDDLSQALTLGNPLHPSSLMILRSDFERIGGFPEDRDCAEDWVFLLRARNAGLEINASQSPAVLAHLDGLNTTATAGTAAVHALGALRHMHLEGLVTGKELVRADYVVNARVASFYANAADLGPCVSHLSKALPGALDPLVARELMCVPMQAIRGVGRRARRPVRQFEDQLPRALGSVSGTVVVLTAASAPAWVRYAVSRLLEIHDDVRVVHVQTGRIVTKGRIARWRLRRATTPDASGRFRDGGDTDEVMESELASLASAAWLVVDLSEVEAYRPAGPADTPVVRVRFGSTGALVTTGAFTPALARGRSIDAVRVTLEWSDRAVVLRGVPLVVDQRSGALTDNGAQWKAALAVPRAVRKLTSNLDAAEPTVPVVAHGCPERWAMRAAAYRRTTAESIREWTGADRWSVALQPLDSGIPTTESVGRLPTIWLGTDLSLADPMLFDCPQGTYLFAERMRPARAATIAAARLDQDGLAEPLTDVLSQPHHLSYPFVFEDGGQIWMIPESSSARLVQLFRAEDFPGQWVPAATLLDGIHAVDPTLHRDSEGYWMWVSVTCVGSERNAELWLFHSKTLTGPWRPHPMNPVVEDPRRARSAGGLFFAEGRLVRPAQDGTSRYGHRIVLNEVIELNPRRYRERPISVIDPAWSKGLVATHTFSRAGQWQALDGARRRRDPFAPRLVTR